MKTLNYKGFSGTYSYISDENIYHGTIDNIKSLIIFEAKHSYEMDTIFINAVDDYLRLVEIYENYY